MPSTRINTGSGDINPTIELLGDWDKASRLLSRDLPLAVAIGTEQGRISAAEKIQALLRANIRNNGPKGIYWPAYSIKYEEKKSRKGGNIDNKLRWTNTYYNSIKVIRDNKGIHVGIPKNIKSKVNKKNPLPIGRIAVILERGSYAMNIPARPLWAPTFKEFGGKQRIAYHIVFHIRKNIYLLTGLRAKVSL